MFLQDDYMYHYINRITASACDFVLSGCPLSVLEISRIGIQILFLTVEADGAIFKNHGEKRFTTYYFLEELKIIETKSQNT